MRQITTLGTDTAKQVFQLHGVDHQGHVVLHKRVSRKQLLPLLAQLPPCLVGLEACGGSHYCPQPGLGFAPPRHLRARQQ